MTHVRIACLVPCCPKHLDGADSAIPAQLFVMISDPGAMDATMDRVMIGAVRKVDAFSLIM